MMKAIISPSLQQTQKLVMTPKLQQAIQVLAMTRQELQQYLEQAMELNPLLEMEENVEEEMDLQQELDSRDMEVKTCHICGAEAPLNYRRCPNCGAPLYPEEDSDNMLDIDLDAIFDDTVSITERLTWEEEDEERPRENIAGPVSFQEYLMAQFRAMKLDEEESLIGETIIRHIDDSGLLSVGTDQIADMLGVDKDKVEKVLKLIQESLDPIGVGARDVRESLLIQLKARGEGESLAAKIVKDHFDDLLKNHIPKIAKDLAVDINDVLNAINRLKTLNPKPGNGFGSGGGDREIIPDVIVELVDGEYKVILNDEGLPRLRVNPRYVEMLKNKESLPPETREWLESYWRKAIDLLKMVEQRRQTVRKVTEAIADVQRDFLEKGFKYLKPLTLRQIAEMVGVHESTVSRVVNGKYVQTPMGIFELKQFFSSGLETEAGSEASSVSVKEMIKEIIENEDPAKPLSDNKIVEKLAERGIKIARRTVAKYRSELGIPPSSRRRREW